MVKRPRITTERNIAMALDQSALLEVLDALRTADAGERITQAAETIYQALIDAELTAFIGLLPMSAPRPAPISATARVRARCPRSQGTWNCGFPSCAPGHFSRRCWSGVAGSISACSRW
ncbi:transposase, Mutator family protein [Mycobacterium avium MAV_120809_2495]|nr:transposase, Mutator family protein [Mycobacterium avium MAV_120809_2495]EUA17399.1 transposase, Mutator family protein [Mycobacterium xenopi 3993]